MQNKLNIAELFFRTAAISPEEIAIVENEKHITYAQLAEEVISYAAYLKQKGLSPGDRILIFVPMGIDLYTCVLAAFYVGAVVVFLDEWVNKSRMELCCKIANCKASIAPFKIRMLMLFSKELRKIPLKLNPENKGNQKTISIYNTEEDATALITFTTGSTGIPKAANRTHAFLRAQFDALQPLLSNESKIDMTLLPIVLLLNLGLGKTTVLGKFNPRKPHTFSAETVVEQLRNNKVTSLTFSPFYLITTAKYQLDNALQLPELKLIISGGGPVFPDDARLIRSAFPDAAITLVYGSTEAEPISHCAIDVFIEKSAKTKLDAGLFVGKADDATQIKIIPITENALVTITENAQNQIGEIIVAGNHVLTDYFNNTEAFLLNKINSNSTIWHRTGDAGYFDAENNLFLMGRCKQIIHWQAASYYPFLIEQELRAHKGVVAGTMMELHQQPVIIIQVNDDSVKQALVDDINREEKYANIKIIFVSKYLWINVIIQKLTTVYYWNNYRNQKSNFNNYPNARQQSSGYIF